MYGPFQDSTLWFRDPTGLTWSPGSDPYLQQLGPLDAWLRGSIDNLWVCVEQPRAFMTWLLTNDAALITDLTIFFNPKLQTDQQWSQLFEILHNGNTNLQNLSVFWDDDGPLGFGRAASEDFIHGLAQLHVENSVDMSGLYPRHWGEFLKANMCPRPMINARRERKRSRRCFDAVIDDETEEICTLIEYLSLN